MKAIVATYIGIGIVLSLFFQKRGPRGDLWWRQRSFLWVAGWPISMLWGHVIGPWIDRGPRDGEPGWGTCGRVVVAPPVRRAFILADGERIGLSQGFGETRLWRRGQVPRRWLLVGGGMLGTLLIVVLVAGGLSLAVFQTFVYSLLLVPLVFSAGVLGVTLTRPFKEACSGCAWPDLFRAILSFALGLGALSLATLGLGAVHLLNPPWIPPLLMGVAVGVGIVPAREFWRKFDWSPLRRPARRGEWIILVAAVPIGVMLIAATFPPGSLWASEGRGYDVVEYHLEVPREYGAANSIAPVSHNVYSYLPANVEMGYLLVMQGGRLAGSMSGGGGDVDALLGVYGAQSLHALLALLTVLAVGMAPLRLGSGGRMVAMLTVLAIPWTIVTGSLAYDVGGMMLYGVLALSLAFRREAMGWRTNLLIGMLLGLAVGSKLTAGVFFAVPVATVLLVRGYFKETIVVAGVAVLLYSPWALRAAIASGGNPVFPLAANVLPRDGWTAEQVERFNRGHAALAEEQSLGGRLAGLGREAVLNEQWSPGWASIYTWAGDAAPSTWWKHVGLLWVVVPLAVGLAFLRGAGNAGDSRARELGMAVGILALQVMAWMFFTHLQARFLLPVAAPLAWIVGLGAEGESRGAILGTLRLGVATVVGAVALCTIFLLLPEAGLLGGVQAVGNRRHQASPPPPIGELFTRVVNVAAAIEKPAPGGAMPEGKILLVGNAAPLFWEGESVYNTTFDDNRLGDALRAGGPAGAAQWLRERGFNYVVIDWAEVKRLRGTYGFDGAITPEAVAAIVRAGIRRVEADVPGNIEILQVKAVTQ